MDTFYPQYDVETKEWIFIDYNKNIFIIIWYWMVFDDTLGTYPLGTVYPLIIIAAPLLSGITSETMIYCCINQHSACN